jgi:hypothetical protein
MLHIIKNQINIICKYTSENRKGTLKPLSISIEKLLLVIIRRQKKQGLYSTPAFPLGIYPINLF